KLFTEKSQPSRISDIAMAYAVSSSIPTTASRFALLQLESDTESEPENGKSGQAAGKSQASGGRSSANERRREKRRRMKEQKQIEANELTSEMFEADLQKALLLSKLEYEEHKKERENTEGTYPQSLTEVKREKRKNQQGKDKPLTVSLEDFQSDSNIGMPYHTIMLLKNMRTSSQTSMNNGEFSHKLEDDVHRILEREKRREQLTDCNEVDNCKSREQNQACKKGVTLK
ncbi:UNVERIFIED_CONTAM: hypothetical protein H355_006963, partial [Colinus virginianus]